MQPHPVSLVHRVFRSRRRSHYIYVRVRTFLEWALHSRPARTHCNAVPHWERHFARHVERGGVAAAPSRRAYVAGRGVDLAALDSDGVYYVLIPINCELRRNMLL